MFADFARRNAEAPARPVACADARVRDAASPCRQRCHGRVEAVRTCDGALDRDGPVRGGTRTNADTTRTNTDRSVNGRAAVCRREVEIRPAERTLETPSGRLRTPKPPRGRSIQPHRCRATDSRAPRSDPLHPRNPFTPSSYLPARAAPQPSVHPAARAASPSSRPATPLPRLPFAVLRAGPRQRSSDRPSRDASGARAGRTEMRPSRAPSEPEASNSRSHRLRAHDRYSPRSSSPGSG